MRLAALGLLLASAPHGGPSAERGRVVARDLDRLQSPDGVEALLAARALGRAGALEAIPALWRLWRSEHRDCRYAALNALAALGDEAATELIVRGLRSEDPFTVHAAIQRLEIAGRPDLAVHLEALFGDARNPGDGNPCEIYLPIGTEAARVYVALLFPPADGGGRHRRLKASPTPSPSSSRPRAAAPSWPP